jgi:hypothetical protein
VTRPELLAALEDTMASVRRLETSGLRTSTGASARAQLQRLHAELSLRHEEVAAGAELDREWASRTVRWVAAWLPDGELPLLARLGAMVRASAS